MPEDKLRKVYDAIIERGVPIDDLGDYPTFVNNVVDTNLSKKLYSNLISQELFTPEELGGEFNEFYTKVRENLPKDIKLTPHPEIPTTQLKDDKDGDGFSDTGTLRQEPEGDLGAAMSGYGHKGLNMLGSMLSRGPQTLSRFLVAPQNWLADQTGQDWLRGDAETLTKVFDPLGVNKPWADFYDKRTEINQKKIEENNPEYKKGILEAAQEGDWGTAGKNLLGGLLESTPSSLAMMMSAPLGPASMTGFGTVMFGGEKMKELEQQAPDMPEWKKSFISAASGAMEGLFETALGAGAFGRAMKDIVTTASKDVAKKEIKTKVMDRFSKMIAENPYLAAFGEGFEEVGTQYAQNAIDKYSGYNPDLKLSEGVADAFIMGMAMGGVYSGVGYGTKGAVSTSERLKKRKQLLGGIDKPLRTQVQQIAGNADPENALDQTAEFLKQYPELDYQQKSNILRYVTSEVMSKSTDEQSAKAQMQAAAIQGMNDFEEMVRQVGHSDDQRIVTAIDKAGDRWFITDGDVVTDTESGTWKVGMSPVSGVNEKGEKKMISPKDIKEVGVQMIDEQRQALMDMYNAQLQNAQMQAEQQQQAQDAELDIADAATPDYTEGDRISYKGEVLEVTDASDLTQGIEAARVDDEGGRVPVFISPQEYNQAPVLSEEELQPEPQQEQEVKTPDKATLEYGEGRNKKQLGFVRSDEGVYTSEGVYEKEKAATKDMKELDEVYPNLEFEVQNDIDPEDPFARNAFTIVAKPKNLKQDEPGTAEQPEPRGERERTDNDIPEEGDTERVSEVQEGAEDAAGDGAADLDVRGADVGGQPGRTEGVEDVRELEGEQSAEQKERELEGETEEKPKEESPAKTPEKEGITQAEKQAEGTPKKQPWEMTREEWLSDADKAEEILVGTDFWENHGQYYVKKGSDPEQRIAPKDLFTTKHEEEVKQALSEGKQVPAEVLKDYPELTKPDKTKKGKEDERQLPDTRTEKPADKDAPADTGKPTADKGTEGKDQKVINLDKKKRAKPQRIVNVTSREPQSLEESILQFLASGGRFKADDFVKHTGFKKKSKEYRQAQLYALKNDGVPMDLAHEHLETFGMEDDGAMDLINEIINIITSYKSVWGPVERLEKLQNETGEVDITGRRQEDYIPPELLEQEEDDYDETISGTKAVVYSNDPEINDVITSDDFTDEGLINWEKLNEKIAEDQGFFTTFPFGLNQQQLSELKKIVTDEIQRETQKSDEPGSPESKGTEQKARRGGERDVEGDRTEEEGQVNTEEQQRVAAEIDEELADLRKQLADVKKRRADKIAELQSRPGLFGDTRANLVGELFSSEFDPSEKNFKKALQPFDDEIASLERDIAKTERRRETALKEAGRQTSIEQEPKDKGGEKPSSEKKSEKIDDFGEKIGGARKDTAKDKPRRKSMFDQGKQPKWAKGYRVLENEDGTFTPIKTTKNNRFIVWRGIPAETKQEAEQQIKLGYIAGKYGTKKTRDKDTYEVYRKVTDRKFHTIKDGFSSREDAMQWMIKNADYLVEYKPEFPERPHIEDLKRTGKKHRSGNVSVNQFLNAFGFKGGEFGNWIPQDERQRLLNFAYDGLMDLADVLGVSPTALSLGGNISIAFGSRGHGLQGSAAHYERDRAVFNLTRMKGAGSVAHEWFHALDHYFGFQDKGKTYEKNEEGKIKDISGRHSDFLSHGALYNSKARKELVDAFKELMKTIYSQPKIVEVSVDRFSSRLERNEKEFEKLVKYIRDYISSRRTYGSKKDPATKQQLKRFNDLIDRIRNGNLGDKAKIESKSKWIIRTGGIDTHQVFKDLNELLTEITGRGHYKYSSRHGGFTGGVYGLESLYSNMVDLKGQLEKYSKNNKEERRTPTKFRYDAEDIDAMRASNYWTTEHEMAARAFEAYVEDKIEEKGNVSQYLVHSTHGGYYKMMFNLNPYPEGEERKVINKAFENFFDVVEEKQEGERTILFQAESDPFYSNTQRALDAIQQPKATPEQFRKMLEKNGAKKAELKWMRWDEFVEGKKSLTKEDVQGWLNENWIEVEEVEKAEITEADIDALLEDEVGEGMTREEAREYLMNDEDRAKHQDYQLPGGENYGELLLTMPVRSKKERQRLKELDDEIDVLENQRKKIAKIELEKGKAPENNEEYKRITKKIKGLMPEWAYLRYDDNAGIKSFRTTHYSELNILAHVRFNERTDADGNRVLFIEEIQSDWAQKGKKEGFKVRDKDIWVYEPIKDKKGKTIAWSIYNKDNRDIKDTGNTKEDALRNVKSKFETRTEGVPDMPFKQTSQWTSLALRRMVRYAAENGFDKIAWTTGEQQYERWGSERIDWELRGVKGYQIRVKPDVDFSIRGGKLLATFRDENNINPEEELKRIAEKYNLKESDLYVQRTGSWKVSGKSQHGGDAGGIDIENQARQRGLLLEEGGVTVKTKDELRAVVEKTLSQSDATQAGIDKKTNEIWDRMQTEDEGTSMPRKEGIQSFYDKILPNTANKIFKKYGVKSEPLNIPVIIDPEFAVKAVNDEIANDGQITAHSLPLNEKLTNAALGGFPLFQSLENPFFRKYETIGELLKTDKVAQTEFETKLREKVAEFQNTLGVPIVVLNTMNDLPAGLRRQVKDEMKKSPGFYDTGGQKVYIILNNTHSLESATRTILHEAVAHHGLRQLLGARFDRVLDQVWKSMDQEARQLMETRYRTNTDTRLLAEEYLAMKSERASKPTFIQKAIAKLRDILRRMFGGYMKWTNNDIKVLLNNSRRNMEERARGKKGANFVGEMFEARVMSQNDFYKTDFYKDEVKTYKGLAKELDGKHKDLIITSSEANTTNSFYIKVLNKDYKPILTFRISDHSENFTHASLDQTDRWNLSFGNTELNKSIISDAIQKHKAEQKALRESVDTYKKSVKKGDEVTIDNKQYIVEGVGDKQTRLKEKHPTTVILDGLGGDFAFIQKQGYTGVYNRNRKALTPPKRSVSGKQWKPGKLDEGVRVLDEGMRDGVKQYKFGYTYTQESTYDNEYLAKELGYYTGDVLSNEAATEIQSIMDAYNEGSEDIGTVQDVAEAIEGVDHYNQNISEAIRKYKFNVAEDMDEWGLRGDFEQYESELLDVIETELQKAGIGSGIRYQSNEKPYLINEETGEPLILWHGTPYEAFGEFDEKVLGRSTGAVSAKQAFFFTDNPNVADTYRKDDRSSMYDITPVKEYVDEMSDADVKKLASNMEEEMGGGMYMDTVKDMRNSIVDIAESDMGLDESGLDIVLRNMKEMGIDTYEMEGEIYSNLSGARMGVKLRMENPLVVEDIKKAPYKGSMAKVVEEAKKKGHDGFIVKDHLDYRQTGKEWYENDFYSDIYGVFNSSQIDVMRDENDSPLRFQAEGEMPEFIGEFLRTSSTLGKLEDPLSVTERPEFKVRKNPMVKGGWETFREYAQDKMLSVRRLQEEVLKRGGTVNEFSNPYREENLSQSASRAQMTYFDKEQWQPLLEAVADIIKETSFTTEDINRYLLAKHSPEHNQYMAEKKDQEYDPETTNYSGFTTNEAMYYIDQFERAVPEEMVERLHNTVRDATNFILERWYQDGFISKEEFDDLIKRYDYYVPKRGWSGEKPSDVFDYTKDDIKGSFNPNKAAKGRSSIPDDPLPHIITMAYTSIISGNKNRVKQQALNLVLQNKQMDDLFKLKRVYLVRDENGEWNETVERPPQEMFDEGRAKIKYNRGHEIRNTIYNAQEHEVTVYKFGEKYVIVFPGDPNIARALNNENMVDVPKVLEYTLGNMTRYLSMVYTSKNPAFIPVNWLRDITFATMSHAIRSDGDVKKFMKNVPAAAKAIHRHLSGKAEKNPTKLDREYREFMELGTETGYVHLDDFEKFRKQILRDTRILTGQKQIKDHITHNRVVRTAGRWIDYMAIMSENMARFATYRTSLQQGKTKKQAAQDGKDVTVNFNRKGRIGALLGSLWAFYNANIQGGHTFAKLAKHHGKKFTAFTLSWGVLGFIVSELARLFSPEDDEGNKYYDMLSEFTRENYMILPNPLWFIEGNENAKNKFLKIPLPHGFRAVYSMGVVASEAMHGLITTEDAVWNTLDNTVSAFSPLSFDVANLKEGKFPARTFIPTGAQPVTDIWMNENFMGSPVYKESFTKDLEEWVPDSEKGMPYVNPFIANATKKLNKLAGGDEVRSAKYYIDPKTGEIKESGYRGALDINPSKIEHLLEGYTGGTGKFFNNVVKTATDVARKISGDPEAEIHTYSLPIARRFVASAHQGNYWRDFFEIGNKVKTYEYFKRAYQKDGDVQMFRALEENARMRSIANLYNSYYKNQIKPLRDAVKDLPEDGDPEPYYEAMDKAIQSFLRDYKYLDEQFEKIDNNE